MRLQASVHRPVDHRQCRGLHSRQRTQKSRWLSSTRRSGGCLNDPEGRSGLLANTWRVLCPQSSPAFVLKPSSVSRVAAVTATFPCGWIIPRALPNSTASRWPRLIGISALQNTFWHGRKAVLIPRPTSLQPASIATSGGIKARGNRQSPNVIVRSCCIGCPGDGGMVPGSSRVGRLDAPEKLGDPTGNPA
jgi:hypothetical protein